LHLLLVEFFQPREQKAHDTHRELNFILFRYTISFSIYYLRLLFVLGVGSVFLFGSAFLFDNFGVGSGYVSPQTGLTIAIFLTNWAIVRKIVL